MCLWRSESGYIIIFHRLSKLSQAKFSILCDFILLVRLQEKFEIDHTLTLWIASCCSCCFCLGSSSLGPRPRTALHAWSNHGDRVPRTLHSNWEFPTAPSAFLWHFFHAALVEQTARRHLRGRSASRRFSVPRRTCRWRWTPDGFYSCSRGWMKF